MNKHERRTPCEFSHGMTVPSHCSDQLLYTTSLSIQRLSPLYSRNTQAYLHVLTHRKSLKTYGRTTPRDLCAPIPKSKTEIGLKFPPRSVNFAILLFTPLPYFFIPLHQFFADFLLSLFSLPLSIPFSPSSSHRPSPFRRPHTLVQL